MRASLIALSSALALATSAPSFAAGAPMPQPVAINFALLNEGKQVGCGATLPNLGSGHVEARLHDARLYVSGVRLIDKKGERTPVTLAQNDWQYADLALIDFKDARGGNTPCSATKGWTGHTQGACGVTEAVLSMLSIEHGVIPGTLNTTEPDHALGSRLVRETRSQPLRRVISNSFGFGGSNCSLIFGAMQ